MKFSLSSLRLLVLGLSAWIGVAATSFAAIEADVALSYSPDAAARQGGEDNIQVNLANAIIGANSIHETSGTGVRWRIAGFYMSTNNPVDQDNNYVLGLVNSDASFQDVRNFGAAVGADLVSYYAHTTGSAGNAYQPGNYSTMGEQWIWYIVVAHELGHNYGCAHQDGLDGTAGPKTVMMHNYCGGGAQPYFSNPNMWLSGQQLIGNGNVCLGAAQISGGDNAWRIATSAQGKADIAARVVAGPNFNNVVLRWCFTNAPAAAPASTTVSDLVSGASAIVRGNGATFTGKGLRIPGTTTGNVAVNSMSAYIDLPNGIISSRTNITIEIWATPLSAPNWARICDFGRTTETGNGAAGEWTGAPGSAAPGATSSSDDIMLSAAINTSLGSQRFEAKLNGGTAVTLDAGLATTAAVQHHYAITFSDGVGDYAATGGRWQWFRDGDAIAYLDVDFKLASIEDVNNWLGRSMWSADNNANNEYAEVRISNVALSRGELLAHSLLGANFFPTATVMLTNSDAVGASSFNAAGQWNSGVTPNAAQTYETFNYSLRTPASGGSFSFGGNALKITGGSLIYKGTASSTITVNNLTLDGGTISHAGSGTCALAGSIAVTTNGASINAVNGVNTLSASLSGGGPLEFLGNATTLTGNNSAFTGKWSIGNGAPGAVTISSPTQFGAVPASFASNHITLNRGTLTTLTTMTLNDANRGILFERGGGTLNVAAGTTLTLGNVHTPNITASLIAGALIKSGGGTLVFSNANSTFRGALYMDSGSTTANDGIVRIVNNQTLANAKSPIYFRNNSGAAAGSILQLDGTAGNLTLSQGISLFGRNSTIPAIQNIAGTNTISGGLTSTVGGANYWIQSDANSQLNFGGTITTTATGARTFTFLGNGQHNITGAITDGSATVNVTKSGSGTMTLGGANTYSGSTTVSAGTLLVNGVTAAGGVTVANAATLGGSGTIGGAVTVQAGGTMSPGTGIGKLTVNNSVTLQAGSTTRMELNKATNTNDVLRATAALNFGGNLIVTNLAGVLVPGDTFPLFEGASFGGTFSSITLPALNVGLTWSALTNGTISVIATNVPTITSYALQGNGTFEVNGSGAASQGYTLQAATNLVPPIAWVAATNTVAATNGLFQLLDLEATNYLQRFYRVSAP